MPPRFFTVEQANRLLPEIRGLIERLRSVKQSHVDNQAAHKAITEKSKTNGHNKLTDIVKVKTQSESNQVAAQQIVAEMRGMGVEVKDLEEGLVDFPSLHRGRRVLLCWKYGEPEVAFWHEVDAGFAGRQPIRPPAAQED